jgi:hypothetical protein
MSSAGTLAHCCVACVNWIGRGNHSLGETFRGQSDQIHLSALERTPLHSQYQRPCSQGSASTRGEATSRPFSKSASGQLLYISKQDTTYRNKLPSCQAIVLRRYMIDQLRKGGMVTLHPTQAQADALYLTDKAPLLSKIHTVFSSTSSSLCKCLRDMPENPAQ